MHRFCICACLAPQDAFALTECSTGECPPLCSGTSPLTTGRYLQESTEMKRAAWTRHVSWRLKISTGTYLDDLRSAEIRTQHLGRLHPREETIDPSYFEDNFHIIEGWHRCISTARQREEDERGRGYNVVDLCRRVMLQMKPRLDGLAVQ